MHTAHPPEARARLGAHRPQAGSNHAASRTQVTVVTLFTEAGPPRYTLSARRYLRQVGARDAKSLYRERRRDDSAALEPMGVTWVHAGLTEALYRLRPHSPGPPRWARLLPELAHIYPLYRRDIISGRIAPADGGTLHGVREVIQRLAYPGPVLAGASVLRSGVTLG